ncbi:glucose 1-dehydrogenase [Aliidiomarina halalkaliphila]|uniref:Glucose 1-dehydrogenase n=1 Tax=Aliidiomarina halalkaliphila TaxID=2593535 RepID=A0A552X586_9GAMM|nr:glucose 1-dehydrogenase [Aliidiomarina halalkaliphila]TRW50170.1 glucose 1-dehydrogenase [Aliidiomarina halalkaliphila]
MTTSPVALITGAAAGIGKETALAYARSGCDVVVADIQESALHQLVKDIKLIGVDALAVTTDVSDINAVKELHNKIMERFGRLDYACNNAGIEGENAPTAESSLENYDRVMNINVRGLYACMQAQLAIMSSQGRGSIVNMASVAGLIGFPGLPAYCASKGAVVQLTKTAAVEYAEQGVRVNAVCPGAIKTDMIDRITSKDPETEKQFAALHPMNRMGTAEEVANAVVFLSLPGASFITGQALAVDGGMVAR